MCNWCNKETKGIPMASGVKVPMICEHCGTEIRYFDWRQLRDRMKVKRDVLIKKYMKKRYTWHRKRTS